ncbi:SDR family NAD(P)-dependent oxidoreductase [Streptomyces ipomoeae]|uniref:SDR family NAD(P)-dependent oxidoreductase n=1 Tax=Streptomyces ipomoeae TaxID=103232 RepID=UPI00114628D6|nr:SDR family NAD(P)-dependent oxidoreductase [Streptomyces ipomoeae]MDX2939795.1 SDR family NAD(P)-dependent oxidoreductase [Streptomyces ipomoeae]TQE17197.1 SDR family NAD(P)-dependent oxidoreductase [Streptomyces ipomoeae]
MSSSRIAVVTGANQGLGRGLVEVLAARMNPDDLVLLTGRDPQRVAAAAREVAALESTRSRVEGRVLDVTDTGAISALATELKERHGGVDVMLSNAFYRLVPDRPQHEQADEFISVSNIATHAVLRSFGPVMRRGGRLIVVASALGTLGHLNPQLRPLFDEVTLEDVERAVDRWRSAAREGTAREHGWPTWLNAPSKVAQVAAVRAVAAERRSSDLANGILVAAVCPGMVDTGYLPHWYADRRQAQSPTEAAGPIADLILTDTVNPAHYGELIQFGKVLPWPSGTPDSYEQEHMVTA